MTDKKNTTIYDVARRADVSRQTVSRVINDRPDVSDATRKHVQQVIAELDYRPSAVAQSLSRQKSQLLGVVTAGLRFIGPSRTLSGITAMAETLGYGLLLKELAHFNTNDVEMVLRWFQSHQVEGIIWAVPQVGANHAWLDALLEKVDIPILFLTMPRREGVAVAAVDNYSGARAAVQHLIKRGKKHIAHIAGPGTWWEAQQRRAGWSDALSAVGYPIDDGMCVEGNWSSKSGMTAFAQLCVQFPMMDAVFAANDQMALCVLQAAAGQGLRIPQDLMVVGFDGIPEAEFYSPPLTTVHQGLDMLGHHAVEELVKIIEKKGTDAGQESAINISIQPELVIRASTALR